MSHKLLNIPVIIWIAQISYVVIALALLFYLIKTLRPVNLNKFLVVYLVLMLVIDVIWRLIASKYIK